MLHSYFDKTYLINLAKRTDRLELSKKVCGKIGLEFERYEAISGDHIQNIKEYDPVQTRIMRWNKNAAGLVLTTLNILKEAKEKNYESILILEDDVEFNPILSHIVEERMKTLPNDWELFYFGATHLTRPELINPYIGRVKNSNSCHCYAIRNTVFDDIIELIQNIEFPIDYYLRQHIHPRNKSYCFMPNMAYQFSGISDIHGGYYNTDFIKQY